MAHFFLKKTKPMDKSDSLGQMLAWQLPSVSVEEQKCRPIDHQHYAKTNIACITFVTAQMDQT